VLICVNLRQKRKSAASPRPNNDNKDSLTPKMHVLKQLAVPAPLLPEYKDHKLKGDWIDFRECHIEPDWLLIYTWLIRALFINYSLSFVEDPDVVGDGNVNS